MKKILVFATAAATGLVAYYMINRQRNGRTANDAPSMHADKGHHVTDVFSKAKRYAAGDV